jgi:ribonuclease HI
VSAAGGGARHPLVAIYADESCLGNGKKGDTPGAAGGLVEYRRPESADVVRRDFWISERSTTNNRMALRSAIEGFRAISRKGGRFSVVFTSDSRYLVDGMSEWVHGWARRGWTRKTGPIENLELWKEALEALGAHEVQWRWVRGHVGHAQNEYANHLATRAAADQTESGGLVESKFADWLTTQRLKGVVKGVPDPFPESSAFAAARSLPSATAGRM